MKSILCFIRHYQLVLLLSIVTVFSFALVSSKEAVPPRIIKIGVSFFNASGREERIFREGLERFNRENGGFEFLFANASHNNATQRKQLIRLFRESDVLVAVLSDDQNFKEVIRKGRKQGIPVVAALNPPPDKYLDDLDSYVGPETEGVGTLQAEWVINALPRGGKMGIVRGPIGHKVADERTYRNEKVFQQSEHHLVNAVEYGNWSRVEAYKIAEGWFYQKRGLRAILCNNDEMAIGVLAAVREAGIPDDEIVISAVGSSPESRDFVGNGIDSLFVPNIEKVGYEAARNALLLADDENVQTPLLIPYSILTAK